MPRNKIDDLRNHLFAQIEKLNDDDLDFDKKVKRAKAISGLAQEIINSARIELDYYKMVRNDGRPSFISKKTITTGEQVSDNNFDDISSKFSYTKIILESN